MAVPLIPDRVTARSLQARWWASRSDASAGRHDVVSATAAAAGAISIAVLVIGAASGWVPVPAALSIAFLVPAAVVDVEQHRLPDIWVGAALLALLMALAVTGAAGGQVDVIGSLIGAMAMCLPILALHLVSPAAMGFGDVKVSIVLGAALGSVDWRLGLVALCGAALGGAGTGLATRRRTIPFGPFLVFAAGVVLLAHGPIVDRLFIGDTAP